MNAAPVPPIALQIFLGASPLEALLSSALQKLDHIIMQETQALEALQQATATLDAANTTLQKVSGETTQLLIEVATLRDLAAQEPTMSPAMAQAIQAVVDRSTAVQAAAAGVDALVPDQPAGG